MTERPILFSGPMVRALLAGRKTQTRRLVKPQPPRDHDRLIVEEIFPTKVDRHGEEQPDAGRYGVTTADGEWCVSCPYGAPGDRLWVREAWARTVAAGTEFIVFREGDNRTDYGGPWKPGIHLFRSDARMTLNITNVRVERLKDITGKDILAEGAVERAHDDQFGHNPISAFDGKCYMDLLSLWQAGWDSINGKRAPFASNPWVWVVEFQPLPQGER